MPALHQCLVQLTLPFVCCINVKVPDSGGIVLNCSWLDFRSYIAEQSLTLAGSVCKCLFPKITRIIFFFFFLEKLIAYQREFHALKERLRIAEHRTLQRSSELNAILEQFRRAVAETNGSKNAMNNFSGT